MRRRIALALCVLWIVGFEVMPWMHVAMHDRIAPHYHDANGTTIYIAESDPIPAGGHVHTHVYPRLPGHHDKHDDRFARLVGALHHGKDTLAHHGIAVPAPPPVWTQPLPVDRRPITLAAEVVLAPRSLDPLAAVARGPPKRLS
ncbi:MAG TPA: hypothetical protein VGG74_30695 [Kofleriaceae bacterium]